MKKLRITVGKKTYDVTVEVLSDDTPASRHVGGRPAEAATPVAAPIDAPRPSRAAGVHSPGAVLSPMAGTVKAVLVKTGDEVEAGGLLVVLEAMKMENKITAPTAGTVKSVNVKDGEAVLEGYELLSLE